MEFLSLPSWNHGRALRKLFHARQPSRPAPGFWIRYTIFSPRGKPEAAIGELWAVYFDGENAKVSAAKTEVPLADCSFSNTALDATIASSRLSDGALRGAAQGQQHAISWDLSYHGGEAPLLMLPRSMYERGFPKAKAVVGLPNAIFNGTLKVDDEEIAVQAWAGSQNHNWGSRHTDCYAWGQVAGFDNDPEAFLECATSRVRIGPVFTPWMSLVVLRVGGEEIRLNSIGQALRAYGRYRYFHWLLDSSSADTRVRIKIEAPSSAFVGLCYYNPPGGTKTCLNSKLASCRLTVERKGCPETVLETTDRAAFEILTDDTGHGIPVLA